LTIILPQSCTIRKRLRCKYTGLILCPFFILDIGKYEGGDCLLKSIDENEG